MMLLCEPFLSLMAPTLLRKNLVGFTALCCVTSQFIAVDLDVTPNDTHPEADCTVQAFIPSYYNHMISALIRRDTNMLHRRWPFLLQCPTGVFARSR